MEQMDAAAVAAWFAEALKLPQYAGAVKEHEVDGDVLLDLVERDKLAALEITSDMHQRREKQIGGSGGSLEPPGPLLEPPAPLLTHLHTVYMAYSECLSIGKREGSRPLKTLLKIPMNLI